MEPRELQVWVRKGKEGSFELVPRSIFERELEKGVIKVAYEKTTDLDEKSVSTQFSNRYYYIEAP